MKKFGIIVGIFFGVILLALFIIPLVVDVDQFRPKIVQSANEKMNGTLEIGKLTLSLWGKIHVRVDGMRVLDLKKNQVLAVKDASLDSSYGSIFSGAPLITASLDQPDITVIKDKDGKLNVMSLMKETPVDTNGKPTAPAPGSGKTELPSMLVNAHTGIEIKNAKLIYKDQAMALTNTVDQLNVRVKDFSLTRKTEMEVWADLKTQMGTDLKIEGPLKLNADLTPEVVGGEFKSGTVNATFSADDLTIEKGKLFEKKKGIPAHFRFAGSLDQNSLRLKEAVIKFHNAEVVVSGVYDKLVGANIHFEAKPVDLKPWSELVPMLKEYELEGKLGLTGDVKGKSEALNYNAKMAIQNLSAKGPHLKAKPVLNGTVDILTDRIERFLLDLKGPGNDLTLDGKLISFSKPQVAFTLKSPKGLDLDQWIEFPPPPAKSTAQKDANNGGSGNAPATDDLDALVEPLRKNEMVKAASVDGNVSIAFVKAKGIRIDDISSKVQFHNLVAALSNIHLKAYDGVLSGGFSTDLKPKEPQYNLNLALNNLDMAKAVEGQFQSLKNTVVGKLSLTAQGGGASFNSETAKKRLQMKGDFKFVNAVFKTIDVAKMANDAINGSIGKIADKVPFLKGKNFKVNPNGDSRYDLMTSHFTISNGVLDAPDFFAKATPKHGIDLRGSTKMGLIDQSLDARWELIDTQHVTGADQFNVAVAGKTINNFLAKGDKDPVIIPVTLGCKWSAPCPNYSAAPEYLAGVAANRLSHVAQDEVKQRVQEVGKKVLGDQFKKLFGH